MDNNYTADNYIESNSAAVIIKSLQVNLGYDEDTHIPTIDEFIEDDFYLGKMTGNGKLVYSYWRDALRVIFPNPLFVNYDTIFLRSAIGTGKSSVARFIILYTMAKMILMKNPHEFFGLLPNKELVVFLYAMQSTTITGAMFNPLAEMLDDSPFFRANMNYDKKGYHFKNKVTIKTGSTIARNVGLDIFAIFMDKLKLNIVHVKYLKLLELHKENQQPSYS